MPPRKRRQKARFGHTRQLPSGRWQASYLDPRGTLTPRGNRVRITSPLTFVDERDAHLWLAAVEREISHGTWRHPDEVAAEASASAAQGEPFGSYVERWLLERRTSQGKPLAPSTVQSHERALRLMVYPTFKDVPVGAITPDQVRTWYAGLGAGRSAMRARAYSILRAACTTAVEDGLLLANPCTIRGAGNTAGVSKLRPASLDELEAILGAMPSELRLSVVLATWCALRSGEVRELRRGDIEVTRDDDGTPTAALVRVTRGVTTVHGKFVIGDPKSSAGKRDVTVPPHVVADVVEHLEKHTGKGKDALLFPAPTHGGSLAHSSLHKAWDRARKAAERPDLRFHDLRHTGLTFAAQAGATTRELMERGGHSNPRIALMYQHSTTERQEFIARRLSELAAGEDSAASE